MNAGIPELLEHPSSPQCHSLDAYSVSSQSTQGNKDWNVISVDCGCSNHDRMCRGQHLLLDHEYHGYLRMWLKDACSSIPEVSCAHSKAQISSTVSCALNAGLVYIRGVL